MAAADELHVYQRCFTRQLRVLDAKIARLELQLKDEMASCSALREELHKARAKRDKVYRQQEIQTGGAGAAPPPHAAGDEAPPPADDAMSSK